MQHIVPQQLVSLFRGSSLTMLVPNSVLSAMFLYPLFSELLLQDQFARIMAAYEDRTLSVWLEVAEQFGVTKDAAARLTST